MFQEHGEAPLAWLVFLSIFREDVPWLYEPGMDFYRALQSKKRIEIQKAAGSFLRILKLTQNSKILYRFSRNDEESFFLLRHLDEVIHRIVHQSSALFSKVEEIELEKGIQKKRKT